MQLGRQIPGVVAKVGFRYRQLSGSVLMIFRCGGQSSVFYSGRCFVMAEGGERRFVVKSEEEVKKLLDDGVPAHTRRATETWLAMFTAFGAEQNIERDLTTCSGEELN